MNTLPTLGDTKRINCDLWANCSRPTCGYGAKLDLDALIECYGSDYVVRQPTSFFNRMKCSRCGHVGAVPTCNPSQTDFAKLPVRQYVAPRGNKGRRQDGQ